MLDIRLEICECLAMNRWTVERIEREFGTLDELEANISSHWLRATDEQRACGSEWYQLAHLLSVRAAGPTLGPAVAAALSPRYDWDWEVRTLEWLEANPSEYLPADCGALHANVRKANDLLTGDYAPDQVLGGYKVRAFWTLLRYPQDAETVCVDSWSIRVACDQHMNDAQTKPVFASRAVYEHFQLAYRKAAAELGVLPSTLQAVTWLVRRND